MAINVTKPAINLREKLNEVTLETGIKGEELLNSDTSAQARNVLELDTHLFTDFESTGIDDNATSTAITIDANENVTMAGTVTGDQFAANNDVTLTAISGSSPSYGVIANSATSTTKYSHGLGFTDGTTIGAGIGSYDGGSGGRQDMWFATRNSFNTYAERMRISHDGYLRLAGAGIQFNGDTAAANALDDYETGTFTPTTNGDSTGGFGAAIGEYTKVGNLVTVRVVFSLSSAFTSNSIGGLPFTSTGSGSISSVMGSTPVFTESSGVNTFGRLQTGHSKILFYSTTSNDFHAPNSSLGIYRFMLSYRAA